MTSLQRIIRVLRERGVSGAMDAVARRWRPPRARSLATCIALVDERTGLEIGGPSGNFGPRGLLPLYARVARLDNCNYAAHTVWEGQLEDGLNFKFHPARAPGRQFIAEATDLSGIASSSYDFVLSSHALEHSANPIRAMREILRVLKPAGSLVLILPHSEGTFDHRRPVTTLAHLVDDELRCMSEHDMTHLPEILALHDLSLDPEAGDLEQFKARSAHNFENRCLHHHVFDEALALQLVHHVGMQILAAEFVRPLDIIVVARKPDSGEAVRNHAYLPDVESAGPSGDLQ